MDRAVDVVHQGTTQTPFQKRRGLFIDVLSLTVSSANLLLQATKKAMSYAPIAPFPKPEEIERLASPELAGLAQIWRETRGDLESGGQLGDFLLKLRREWAIETGLIERLYAWDRGVTETLMEQGIHAALIERGGLDRDRAEQARRLIEDQQSVVEGLFEFVGSRQPLTEHYIRSLHQAFTRHQTSTEAATPDGQLIEVPLLRGQYKKHPNNPRRPDGSTHVYCPPELVRDEMEKLVGWTNDHEDVPPEVLSAWLHHRFAQIHPFQDGNGRVARALASLVFLKAGLFPLVIRDTDRTPYLDALAEADGGNIRPLTELLASRQREEILKALGLADAEPTERFADAIVDAAVRDLAQQLQDSPDPAGSSDTIEAVTQRLEEITTERLDQICIRIGTELERLAFPSGQDNSCLVSVHSDRPADRTNLVELTRQFDYLPDPRKRSRFVQLDIVTWDDFRLVIDFHVFGRHSLGIRAVAAYSYRRIALPVNDNQTNLRGPRRITHSSSQPLSPVRPAMSRVFQYNAAEALESTEARFREWLEHDVLVTALEDWRASLQR